MWFLNFLEESLCRDALVQVLHDEDELSVLHAEGARGLVLGRAPGLLRHHKLAVLDRGEALRERIQHELVNRGYELFEKKTSVHLVKWTIKSPRVISKEKKINPRA